MPSFVSVTRKRGDTFAERLEIDTAVTGATFVLNVEGLGALTGAIFSSSATLSYVDFAVSNALVSNGAVGTYDCDIVMTSSSTTRTLVEGKWIIEARTAS